MKLLQEIWVWAKTIAYLLTIWLFRWPTVARQSEVRLMTTQYLSLSNRKTVAFLNIEDYHSYIKFEAGFARPELYALCDAAGTDRYTIARRNLDAARERAYAVWRDSGDKT